MSGDIFITSTGYDPERGYPIKDPSLEGVPTLGACMPNIRRRIIPGDHLFVVSGKLPNTQQFIIGGFRVVEKIDHLLAYHRFPEKRLRRTADGAITGNVIVDETGAQHPLDHHKNFDSRIENYLVGSDPLVFTMPAEIARARSESLDVLRYLSGKRDATSAFNALGRGGRKLSDEQVGELLAWMESIKGM